MACPWGPSTACEASTTICSAKAPVRRPWTIGLPAPSWSGVALSSGNTSSQNTGAPSAQAGQKPQLRMRVAINVVAGLEPGHAGPDRLDHAGRLVAVDGRQFAAPGAVDVGDVAVADRAGGRPDQNLAGAGRPELDRLDGQRRAEGAADGGSGFHSAPGNSLLARGKISPRARNFKRRLDAGAIPFCGELSLVLRSGRRAPERSEVAKGFSGG